MDESVQGELAERAAEERVELVTLNEVEELGKTNPKKPNPPKSEDLCTICYTSGTTGTPKGVMLPHRAVLSDASSVLSLAGYGDHGMDEDDGSCLFNLNHNIVHLSYLPLAHVYERVVMTTLASVGASIGFYQGDVSQLLDDAQTLRPTIFVTVPRLLNRIYDKVMGAANASNPVKKFLFKVACDIKKRSLRENQEFQHWLWDPLVFNNIKARLGGRVGVILTGSAPIEPEVMDFLRICFCCEIYQGYGQTETSAGSTITSRGDWVSGHIGVPIPSNEIKLIDIPDMGYTTKDEPNPRGEICIRGANCFVGYYKEPEMTREALDDEGWVHTGDVGEWDAQGRLRIIDRKKNIFKLAQGEYISPEKVENILSRNKYIAQAFVEGNSLRASLMAVIVPDFEVLKRWAKEQSIEFEEEADLCKEPRVKELIMDQLKSFGSKGSGELRGFEIPRDVYLESTAFSVENNLMTSTFKLKRHQAKRHYAQRIAEMYAKFKD